MRHILANHDRPPYCLNELNDSYYKLLRLARITIPDNSVDPEISKSTFISINRHQQRLQALLPLIHANALSKGFLEDLTLDAVEPLQQASTTAIAANLVHEQWLQIILERLAEKEISVILLKAAAFADNLYRPDNPRTGKDLDLLIAHKDFDTACAILEPIMQPLVIDAHRPVTHATLFERVFRPKEGFGPTVELHRSLTNPDIFNIEEAALWQRSVPHPRYNDERIRILSPEDTLLHLAVHAFRDLDFCTHNLLDAHEVICQWKPDFTLLLKRANEWGARNALYCLLENCRAVMETPIPPSFFIAARPSRALNKLIKQLLLSNHVRNTNEKGVGYRLKQLIAQLVVPDHIYQGARFQMRYAQTRIGDMLVSKNIISKQENP